MSTLGAFLAAAVGPLARRALSGLGVGVITFVGLDTAMTAALEQARAAFNGMPADVMGYVMHAGVHTAFSIIAGGITARVAVVSLKKLGQV